MAKAASPFGKESRVRILRQHLRERQRLTPATAWEYVYEELMWIDGSTGLAHLYESEKAQRGRSLWFQRGEVFTESLRKRLGASDRADLKSKIVSSTATEVAWVPRAETRRTSDELDCFVELLSQDSFPEYVLVTNEYDPGRLTNTDGLARRGRKIDCIYHINLDLLREALADHPKLREVSEPIAAGRIKSLEDMLKEWAERFA